MAVRIVRDAGGMLTGRIRLQKIAFLMHLSGFLRDLPLPLAFEYYYYGPYSEALSRDLNLCEKSGFLKKETKPEEWGGEYSVYSLGENAADAKQAPEIESQKKTQEKAFVQAAKDRSSVLLELAATAAYLYEYEGIGKIRHGNAWSETKSRKQVKARDGRLRQAYEVYETLRELPAPQPLPEIPFLF